MYHDALKQKMGSIDDFYRLYMIPGMFHCARGPAPYEVDWIDIIDQWVSEDKAPEMLTTNYTANSFVQFGTPGQAICPYPEVPSAKDGLTACTAPLD